MPYWLVATIAVIAVAVLAVVAWAIWDVLKAVELDCGVDAEI